MDHAILVAAGTGVDGERLSLHAKTTLAGVPQINRLMITAERSGVKRFTVIFDGDRDLQGLVNKDKRINGEITWHKLGSPIEFEHQPSLVLQSNLVTNPAGLQNLSGCEVSEGQIAFLVDERTEPWVRTKDGGVEELFQNGGKAVGAFVAYGSLLEKSIVDSMDLAAWTQELVGREGVKSVKFKDGYWTRLSSEEGSAKKAEGLLFSYVGKTATGWISRNINSKISIPISKRLVRTPLTPNMISVLINLIGVLSGPLYALGHPVLGGLFLEIATILDRCDGEVARVKLMETKRGQWVDTISDQATIMSFIIGVPVGYYLLTKNPIAIALGVLNLGIFIFFLVWSFYFLAKYTNSGSLVAYFDVDKHVERKDSSFARRLIALLRPIARRNFYALGFLIVSIIGGYPWVLGSTSIALVFFLIHQVEDIIKLKKPKQVNNLLK